MVCRGSGDWREHALACRGSGDWGEHALARVTEGTWYVGAQMAEGT